MLDQKMINDLNTYIKIHLELLYNEKNQNNSEVYSNQSLIMDLEDYIDNNRQPVLNQVLFNLIDKKGFTDAQVYNKAGLDRKLFSKIRTNPDYKPRKRTIVSLGFAMKLNQKEFTALLESGGYSLSGSDTQDLIIKFFLEQKRYDIDELNEAFEFFIPKKQKKKAT